MRTGVPVVPCFIARVGTSERHQVKILPPLTLVDGAGDRDKAVAENVARMNAVIETAIRENPDQWLWMHRRFHTQPEGEARPYPSRRSARRSLSR
ncbi:MAG: hypothetical protein GWO24_00985 [Akkermansiaceae bacterium]|nr:hypothetical protein [Akkermansiaceae bacterium]